MARSNSTTETKPAPKPEKLQSPRGVKDLLPDDHAYFTLIKKIIRHRARQAGFRRISTPILEDKNVFVRAVGDTTDVVEKELYTLKTEGGSVLALKPEGTAGIVRAYIQHGMHCLPQPVELYYIEPHFRHDRPQKGRYRQFHQFGLEVLGESDPAIDAQIIQLITTIHRDLKIAERFTLQINTLGCPTCRAAYLEQLRDYYVGKERSLCGHCKTRLEKNPLRLLDCKAEDCRLLASRAPRLVQTLCEECKDYHAKVLELLDAIKIPYVQNDSLVRGLDYYTRTVFEFWDKTDGAQNAVGGGGRYDGLVEQMGGVPTPACGYASGMERIIEHMKAEQLVVPNKDEVAVFVAQLGFLAKKTALPLLNELRECGVHAIGALGKSSMKAQLSLADRFNVRYALILGEIEVREGKIILRDMQAGKQEIIPLKNAVKSVLKKIGPECLDTYDPSGDLKVAKKIVRPEDELLIADDESGEC